MIYRNSPVTTGNLDSVLNGATVAGPNLVVNNGARRLVANLSALITIEAETENLTFTAKWQGSNDGSTYYDINDQRNVARTALATGTSGDDAVLSYVVDAPAAVYGLRNARCVLVVGGDDGAETDTYSIGYHWTSFDRERF